MAKFKNIVTTAFDIRAGEALPLALLLVHSFALGASLVFFETPANTLFLQNFSVQTLSYVYMLTAVVTAFLGYIYAKLEARLTPAYLLSAILGFLLTSTCIFYLALLRSNAKWLAMGLMLWKDVQWMLGDMAFWALAGLVFNVRQGKRLFGLIGAGEVTARILGGFSIPVFVKYFGTLNLLLISAATMLTALGALIYTVRVCADRFASLKSEPETARDAGSIYKLFKERYLALFFSISILAIVGFFFIDYIFYDRVEGAFSDKNALASFFGVFYAVLGIAELTSDAFVCGPMLTRYGLGFGLLILPIVNAFATGSAAMSGMIFGTAGVFLWMIIGAKLFDEVLRNSIQFATFRILYQPLSACRRLHVQVVRESIIEPVSIGLSGALLLLLTSVLSFKVIHLLCIALFVFVAYIFLNVLLRQEYTRTLMNAIAKKRLQGCSISLEDQSTIQVLRAGLESPNALEVIHCLNLLAENEHVSLESFLVKLLDHPEQRVRQYVLNQIEQRKTASAVESVRKLVERDPAATVRGSALRALCAIGDDEIVEKVSPYLVDPEPEVSQGVLVGLLRSGGIDGVLVAGATLNDFLVSQDAAKRKLAAQVLGDVGIFNFYQPLLTLLRDNELEVKKAALEATGKVKNVKLAPIVLEHLCTENVHEAAFSALIQFGEGVVPILEAAFADARQSHATRTKIAEICGRIGGDKALTMLKKNIGFPEGSVCNHVLSALVMCKYRASNAEQVMIEEVINEEAESSAWILAAMNDIGKDGAVTLLVRALAHEMEECRDRMLMLLSFIYPSETILQVKINLKSDSLEKRANAFEVIDNLIDQEMKRIVFPLLDDIAWGDRLARLTVIFPQPCYGRIERLRQMMDLSQKRSNLWTKTCALYAIGRLRAAELCGSLEEALSDSDPVIRETAAWALHGIDAVVYEKYAAKLWRDPSSLVLRTIKQLPARSSSEN